MSAAPHTAASPSRASDPSQARQFTPGLSDVLGDRLLTFDAATASSIEILRFGREFADAPGFEVAIRKRMEQLARVRHPSLAVIRGLEMPTEQSTLSLVSTHTAGRRLSEILADARGVAFALELIRQVAPALAALHQQGPDVAHGMLTPERIVVTREGRLVVVEQVIGGALAAHKLPAARLQSQFGLAVPSADATLDQRSDIVQLGIIALSLLVGRRIDPADYPANIPALLDVFTRSDATASTRLRPWLERALQLGERPFASGQDAAQAFIEVTEDRPATAPAPEPAPTRQVLTFPKNADVAPSGKPAVDTPATTPAEAVEVAAPSAGRPYLKWVAAAAGAVLVAYGAFAAGSFITTRAPEPEAPPAGAIATDGAGTSATITPPAAIDQAAAGSPRLPSTPPLSNGAALAPPATTATSPAAPPVRTPSSDPSSPVGANGEATGPVQTAAVGAPAATPGVPRFGGIRITAPIDIQVFDGERLLGSTAGPIAIAEGTHVLDLVNEELGYRSRQTIAVRAGQLAPVSVALPNGRLSINAVPWAEVFIDGKPVGETPLANLSIPIGRHEIVFRHPELGEKKDTAVVKVDGLTRVSITFQN